MRRCYSMRSSHYVPCMPLQLIALVSPFVACRRPSEHPGLPAHWSGPFAFPSLRLLLLGRVLLLVLLLLLVPDLLLVLVLLLQLLRPGAEESEG